MNKIPTAQEFAWSNNLDFKNALAEMNYQEVYNLMIEFAKLHVTKALTSAHINMQLPIEDLEFTLNSYPLENIK